ncbi:MAG: hypothetical protein H6741_25630 [Alphaproteobacteria bacterium]|nr:hypothetical protein [Alphaproteobacteria bacterium]MCB9796092.1 hypothetical protein [Alphaproteobacteria bacterium]
MRLYVFGNGNLSWEAFGAHYLPALAAVDWREAEALVCDFRGADVLAMEFLKTRAARVTLLHVGARPRYLPDRFRTQVSAWTLRGGFPDDAARDAAAIEDCTHFLARDFNSDARRTSGTARNIGRCLALGRLPLEVPA